MTEAWTKEPPKSNGYYWFRSGRDIKIVLVDCRTFWQCGHSGDWEVRDFPDAQWCGPLEPPPMPKGADSGPVSAQAVKPDTGLLYLVLACVGSTLKEGDIVRMTETPSHDNVLVRVTDCTLHALYDNVGTPIMLRPFKAT